MKILYIPFPNSDPAQDDFLHALERVHEVEYYTGEINSKPDVIYSQAGSILWSELKRIKNHTGATVTIWAGDYRPTPMRMIDQYDGIADVTFLAADVPELYPNQNVKWLPHGVADWQFREVKEDAEGIVMIANNYGDLFPGAKEREDMAKELSKRDDFKVYGNGWDNIQKTRFVDWKETPDIYNNAKFAVGCNIYNDANKYFSNRPLWAMAAGTCFFMRSVPGIHDLFSMKDCVIYADNDSPLNMDVVDPSVRYGKAKHGQQTVKEKFHYDKIVKMYENGL